MIDLEPIERYSAELPKTMVTPSMRQQIVRIAKQKKLSVAELNRRLWQKFLDEVGENPSASVLNSES